MGVFELLAECSVTFAGFAAVYAALRGSRGPRGAFRAWATVAQGFLAFFCSLAPLLFSNLGLEDMKKVVEQTQFYKTAEDAIALLDGDDFKQTMQTVEGFCTNQELVTDPKYGFGSDVGVKLLFDSSHVKAWKEKSSQ